MKKLPKLSEKLKKEKKLLLTVAAGILGIVFIVISEFIPKSSYKKAETGEQNKNSVSSYEETLEKRLESIISSVDGAGRVQVMVTLDTSEQTQYAKDEKENSKSGDKSSEKSYEKKYVLTDDDGGVVLKTTEPEVRGVIVVCDGGDNAAVKNGITSAVRAALSVDSNKITVLKMKNSEANDERNNKKKASCTYGTCNSPRNCYVRKLVLHKARGEKRKQGSG